MGKLIAYLAACGLALIVPLAWRPHEQRAAAAFAGWPAELDGRVLIQLPDTKDEARFFAQLPVRHARFSDGQRIVLMRWAADRVEGFHLAATCYEAFGFTLSEARERAGPAGRAETCFSARRGGQTRHVCEHIRDGNGRIFANLERWHLARLLGTTTPPYLGISVVE
jgi:hypothetical protein